MKWVIEDVNPSGKHLLKCVQKGNQRPFSQMSFWHQMSSIGFTFLSRSQSSSSKCSLRYNSCTRHTPSCVCYWGSTATWLSPSVLTIASGGNNLGWQVKIWQRQKTLKLIKYCSDNIISSISSLLGSWGLRRVTDLITYSYRALISLFSDMEDNTCIMLQQCPADKALLAVLERCCIWDHF